MLNYRIYCWSFLLLLLTAAHNFYLHPTSSRTWLTLYLHFYFYTLSTSGAAHCSCESHTLWRAARWDIGCSQNRKLSGLNTTDALRRVFGPKLVTILPVTFEISNCAMTNIGWVRLPLLQLPKFGLGVLNKCWKVTIKNLLELNNATLWIKQNAPFFCPKTTSFAVGPSILIFTL